MSELAIVVDRYNGQPAISLISADRLQFDAPRPYIELPLGDDDEFAIFFEAPNGDVDEELLDAARGLMAQIHLVDNMVQASCAAECLKSGLDTRNFEGELVFITMSHYQASLRYFGTGVNTEWDEVAEFREGNWEHVGTANPDLSSRTK